MSPQRRIRFEKTGALPPPLTRAQRIDNVRRLMEVHEMAYGADTDGKPERLPAILEYDRAVLQELTRPSEHD